MRILHVASGDLWGGAEAQLLTQVTSLRNLGYAVGVILLNDGDLAERIRSEGIWLNVIPERATSAPCLLFALWISARKFSPAVIHTHRTKENILGSLTSVLLRVPCIRTVHGKSEASENIKKSIRRRFLSWADMCCGRYLQKRIIAVSNSLAAELRDLYPEKSVVTIQNGINESFLRREALRRATLSNKDRAPINVCFVGRVFPVKRIDLFIDICEALIREYSNSNYRFHVYGDGPDLATAIERVESGALAGLMTFHGHVSDVSQIYRSMDVLVLCSDHEGLPMVVLEALASGVRVVAHAVGGLPELLSQTPLGVLVESQSARQYTQAIIEICGRKMTHDPGHLPMEYTARHNAESIISLYKSLAQKAGKNKHI